MEKNEPTITLLYPKYLDENVKIFHEVDQLCRSLWKEIGWHYLVDIVWILKTLYEQNIHKGATILDAGGGYGILQFILAHHGYNVISVDFSPRKIRRIHGLLFPIQITNNMESFHRPYVEHIKKIGRTKYQAKRLINITLNNRYSALGYVNLLFNRKFKKYNPGKITMVQADLRNMINVNTSSVDAVVSCSAIEHIDPAFIPEAIGELRRVTKNDKPIIITTSASKETDWFHEPSQGWCFTKKTLLSFLNCPVQEEDIFTDYDNCLESYRLESRLKKRLASSYFTSGNNGMPWGIWDPKYVPVGIVIHNG